MVFKSWRVWCVYLTLIGLLAMLGYGFFTDPRKVPSPLIGQQAPNFSIQDLDQKKTYTLEDFKGKPIILNFWASWCIECRAEAKVLEATYQQYHKANNEIYVFGIAIQDAPVDARRFAEVFGKTYPLGLDNEIGQASLDYGLYGVPETFFIDQDGIIRHKVIGEVTSEIIEQQLAKLIHHQ